jgi:hypothetical protein
MEPVRKDKVDVVEPLGLAREESLQTGAQRLTRV